MSDVSHRKAPATTALVPEAHVRMGATTSLSPVARFKLNAWGVVTRLTDAVKLAVSAQPFAKLASKPKPVQHQRQRISDSKIAAILAAHGKYWNPGKAQ